MRTVFTLLAALLIAAAVASWTRSGLDPDPLAGGPGTSSGQPTSQSARPEAPPAASAPPELRAAGPEAPVAGVASAADPLVELVPRAPFLPDADAESDAESHQDPAPAAVGMGGREPVDRSGAGSDRDLAGLTAIERSAEWVRRLLALYEALRE